MFVIGFNFCTVGISLIGNQVFSELSLILRIIGTTSL